MTTIRQPAVAGMFYTANPKALDREIDQMLEEVIVPQIKGSLVALIVPHAGYTYSGATAAHAYKLLQINPVQTVIVISPSHREYFKGISIFNGDAYRTPLGNVALDSTLIDDLMKDENIIELSDRGHLAEHAIEVQLPFLQKVLGDFKLVPVIMGDQNRELCYHLSNKLAKVLKGKNALIVASSDLSHYHTADEADALDKITIDDLIKFDHEQLAHDIENARTEACGGGPIIAALSAAKMLGANHVEILHHCNSGNITGERDAVVGYLSAAITREN
jgi:AmmeMemoRadiSam system protein B